MDSLRSLALVVLCFCIVLGGTAAAVPTTGMAMESTDPAMAMAMNPDCPDLSASAIVSSAHDATAPVEPAKPGCCHGGACWCSTMAHVAFAMRPPVSASPFLAMTGMVAATGSSTYSSPALARLVRPPIS